MRTHIYLFLIAFWGLCMPSFGASFSINQNTGTRDTTMILTFNGSGTHFTNANNTVILNNALTGQFVTKDVISIDSFWAASNTLMYVKITVAVDAPMTAYKVYVQNSVDILLQASNYFLVSGVGLSNSFSIPKRGNSSMIILTPVNTDFANDSILEIKVYHDTILVSTVTIDSFSLLSASALRCRLSISLNAKPWKYKVVVNSRKNGLMKTGFTITPGYLQTTPTLVKLMQGKTWVISADAVNALLSTGAPDSGFAYKNDTLVSSVILDSCVASSDSRMKVYLHIGMDAVPGLYTLKFWNTYDEAIPLTIFVTQYTPPRIVETYPKVFPRGQNLEVTVYGTATNFDKGTTTLKFWKNNQLSDQIVVDSIVPVDSTVLKAYLSIDSLAYAGAYTLELFNSFDAVSAFYQVQVPKSLLITDPLFYSVLSGEQGVVDANAAGALFTKATDANVWISLDSTLAGHNEELAVDSFSVMDDHKLRVWFTVPKTSRGNYYSLYYYSSLDDTLKATSYMEVYSPFITDTSVVLPRHDSISISIKGNFTNFHRTDSIAFGFYDSWSEQVYFIDSGLTCTGFQVLSDTLMTLSIHSGKNIAYLNYYILIRDTLYGYIHSHSPNITIPRPEIKTVTPNIVWRIPQQSIYVETRYLPDLAENISTIAFADTAKIKVDQYSIEGDSVKLDISINKDATPSGGYPLIVTLKDSSTMSENLFVRKAELIDFYPKEFADTNRTFTFVLKGASKQGLRLRVATGVPGIIIDSISYLKEDTITMVGRDSLSSLSQYYFFISNTQDNTIGQGYLQAPIISGVTEIMAKSGEIIFQNPAYGDIVFINKSSSPIKQISIIDIQGKEVYTKDFSARSQADLVIESAAISGLQGLYFLRFKTDKFQILYSKILIAK